MEMRKCMNGHYYDASVNSSCPYCQGNANAGKTIGLNMMGNISADGDSKTLPMGYVPQSAPAPQNFVNTQDDEKRQLIIINGRYLHEA